MTVKSDIADLLLSIGQMTIKQIADRLGKKLTNISRELNSFVADGLVKKVVFSPNGSRVRSTMIKIIDRDGLSNLRVIKSTSNHTQNDKLSNDNPTNSEKSKPKTKKRAKKSKKTTKKRKKKGSRVINSTSNHKQNDKLSNDNPTNSKLVKMILAEFDLIKCYFRTGKRPAQTKAISNFEDSLKLLTE